MAKQQTKTIHLTVKQALLVVVLLIVVQKIAGLFELVKSLFRF